MRVDKEKAFTQEKNVVGKAIAFAVTTTAVSTLEALAPKVLDALKRKGVDARKLTNLRYYIRKAASRMIRDGFIEIKTTHRGKKYFALTAEGSKLLLKYRLGEYKIRKSKRWDGNWRVIIFDIAEKRRKLRDTVRKELINLGFVPLQKSVLVSPYDCEEVALLLKTGLGFGSEVLYMEVGYIENDRWLKKEFDLA